MVEDRRAVLRSDIVPLPIGRRRVVNREKNAQQLAKPDHGRVERDPHDLRMTGVAVADLLVRRIDHLAAGIARFDGLDPLQAVEYRLETPEASSTEGRDLF